MRKIKHRHHNRVKRWKITPRLFEIARWTTFYSPIYKRKMRESEPF